MSLSKYFICPWKAYLYLILLSENAARSLNEIYFRKRLNVKVKERNHTVIDEVWLETFMWVGFTSFLANNYRNREM